MDEYLSAGMAAKAIGMPYQTLVSHINKGNLQAQRFAGNYAIEKNALIAFKHAYDTGAFSYNGPRVSEYERLQRIAQEVSDAVGAKP